MDFNERYSNKAEATLTPCYFVSILAYTVVVIMWALHALDSSLEKPLSGVFRSGPIYLILVV